ncbi:hypothetical protein P154DRAFT_624553 [Amniculicola lignicola CBS 123094]|uniref:Uncharacterized protein n=1 Tax=Amniculicola lignicola CBS 123094 TaxID=1392246 RepID=A0A6A5W037_9PLEO|nr:hypothetical protein P154DRAFT_624553 [Amniculicola lignicola CBS 123094]
MRTSAIILGLLASVSLAISKPVATPDGEVEQKDPRLACTSDIDCDIISRDNCCGISYLCARTDAVFNKDELNCGEMSSICGIALPETPGIVSCYCDANNMCQDRPEEFQEPMPTPSPM